MNILENLLRVIFGGKGNFLNGRQRRAVGEKHLRLQRQHIIDRNGAVVFEKGTVGQRNKVRRLQFRQVDLRDQPLRAASIGHHLIADRRNIAGRRRDGQATPLSGCAVDDILADHLIRHPEFDVCAGSRPRKAGAVVSDPSGQRFKGVKGGAVGCRMGQFYRVALPRQYKNAEMVAFEGGVVLIDLHVNVVDATLDHVIHRQRTAQSLRDGHVDDDGACGLHFFACGGIDQLDIVSDHLRRAALRDLVAGLRQLVNIQGHDTEDDVLGQYALRQHVTAEGDGDTGRLVRQRPLGALVRFGWGEGRFRRDFWRHFWRGFECRFRRHLKGRFGGHLKGRFGRFLVGEIRAADVTLHAIQQNTRPITFHGQHGDARTVFQPRDDVGLGIRRRAYIQLIAVGGDQRIVGYLLAGLGCGRRHIIPVIGNFCLFRRHRLHRQNCFRGLDYRFRYCAVFRRGWFTPLIGNFSLFRGDCRRRQIRFRKLRCRFGRNRHFRRSRRRRHRRFIRLPLRFKGNGFQRQAFVALIKHDILSIRVVTRISRALRFGKRCRAPGAYVSQHCLIFTLDVKGNPQPVTTVIP